MAQNRLKKSPAIKPLKKSVRPDDFESVARRLGCDPDMDKFMKKLGKIAKMKTGGRK